MVASQHSGIIRMTSVNNDTIMKKPKSLNKNYMRSICQLEGWDWKFWKGIFSLKQNTTKAI